MPQMRQARDASHKKGMCSLRFWKKQAHEEIQLADKNRNARARKKIIFLTIHSNKKTGIIPSLVAYIHPQPKDTKERSWSSGMTLAFQAKSPGSIPGDRILRQKLSTSIVVFLKKSFDKNINHPTKPLSGVCDPHKIRRLGGVTIHPKQTQTRSSGQLHNVRGANPSK